MLLLATLSTLVGCAGKPLMTVLTEKRARAMTIPRGHPTNVQYLVQLPRTYHDNTNRVWPMVLFLHGVGGWGDNLDGLQRSGLPKLISQGMQLPCIVVSPQMPKNWLSYRESDSMLEILDDVAVRYRVNISRVHVTGTSEGAFAAALLAAREPERFASLVPICGGVDYLNSLRLRDVPVWAFHGADDPVVPAAESRRLVELVQRTGGSARLTIYPGVGHDCSERAYETAALWEWVLSKEQAAAKNWNDKRHRGDRKDLPD